MKKVLPSLVCGFGAGVLLVTPVIKVFTCCLIIPIAAILSIMLDQKANPTDEKITIQKGLVFGLFTGLFAAGFGTFFEILITFITHSNDLTEGIFELKKIWSNFPDQKMLEPAFKMFDQMVLDIKENGISPIYALFMLGNNLLSGIIFGLLGGLLGMKIANTKRNS